MPYLLVSDFQSGQDVRKSTFTAPPGTLRALINAHITRGGEVEKRKAFEKRFTLPSGTHGLHSVGDQLIVFGTAPRPDGLPATIVYYELIAPSSPSGIKQIMSVDNFGGTAYSVVQFNDGAVEHFYGDERVAVWDTVTLAVANRDTLASIIASGIGDQSDVFSALNAPNTDTEVRFTVFGPAGVSFTTTTGITDDGTWAFTVSTIQQAVAPTEAVAATSSFDITGGTFDPGNHQITGITVDGVAIMGGPVDWLSSNEETAAEIAAQINLQGSEPNYTAEAVGATVTLTAPKGAAANGRPVVVTTTGTVATTSAANMAGGVDSDAGRPQVDQVAITETGSGTQQATAAYTVTVTADDAATYPAETFRSSIKQTAVATFVKTVSDQMYGASQQVLRYTGFRSSADSSVGRPDPTAWDSGASDVTNAGLIDMSTQDGANDLVLAVGTYQDRIAIFSRRYVQIWSVGPAAEDKQKLQVLNNIGSISPQTVTSFGDQDVFFLAESGVRSLRARDSSNLASAADVGNPIDPELVDYVLQQTPDDVRRAAAIVEPTDGRYWLAVANRMYVFSYFSGSDVSAWSRYELPDRVEGFALSNGRVWFRIGDDLYQYGGASNRGYDDAVVELQTPFLDGDNPAQHKSWNGIDVGIEGVWQMWISTDPDQPDAEEEIGVFGKASFSQLRIPMVAQGSHISVRMRSIGPGYHRLTSLAIHYDGFESA